MRRTIGMVAAFVAVAAMTGLGTTTAMAGADGGSADNGGPSRGEGNAGAKLAPLYPYVGFSSDAIGPKANGYKSPDSAYLSFSDPGDGGLNVNDFGTQSYGKAIFNGDNHGGIEISIAKPTTNIQMYFGNDDPGWMPAGSKARLTAYYKGTKVATTTVAVNRNDTMDQSIAVSASLLDRVLFEYVDGAGNLTANGPIIDGIYANPLCTKVGTNGNNTLVGTGSDDVLCGGGGNDTLKGKGGDDYAYGGAGNDKFDGGAGNDLAFGGAGKDRLLGGGGDDSLYGGAGADRLVGGGGYDYCYGEAGKDSGVCDVSVSIP